MLSYQKERDMLHCEGINKFVGVTPIAITRFLLYSYDWDNKICFPNCQATKEQRKYLLPAKLRNVTPSICNLPRSNTDNDERAPKRQRKNKSDFINLSSLKHSNIQNTFCVVFPTLFRYAEIKHSN